MGTGQRGLHRGTSGLARLRCNHGCSGFRDESGLTSSRLTRRFPPKGQRGLYYQHVWKLHGLPLEWLHDRGSVFISEFMKELNRPSRDQDLRLHRLPSAVRRSDRGGSTRNSRRTSGCSATTTRTTGTNSFLQRNSRAQTTSMPQPKSLPLSRIRAGTLGWALNLNVDVADEDAEAFRDRMQEGLEEAKAALVKAQDEVRAGTTIDDATRLRSLSPGTWFFWMHRISGPIE